MRGSQPPAAPNSALRALRSLMLRRPPCFLRTRGQGLDPPLAHQGWVFSGYRSALGETRSCTCEFCRRRCGRTVDDGRCCYSDQMSRCHFAKSQTAGATTATRPTAIPPLNHMMCNQSIHPRQSRRCCASRDCRVRTQLPADRNYLSRPGESVRWRTCRGRARATNSAGRDRRLVRRAVRPEGSRRDALSLGQAGQRELGGPGLDEYELGNLLRLRS